MKTLLHYFRHFYFVLLLFVFSESVNGQAIGDYRSNVATGDWTSLSSWQYYNGSAWVTPSGTSPQGYPGQYSGSGAVLIQGGHKIIIDLTITTLSFGTLTITGRLTLTGDNSAGGMDIYLTAQSVIVTPSFGFIEFNNKLNLRLPINAYLQVTVGGLDIASGCSANQVIYIGATAYSKCNGGGILPDFQDLMAGGGTLNPIAVSNSPVCQKDTINLLGSVSGVLGTTTSEGSTSGVNYSWSIQAPDTSILTSSLQDYSFIASQTGNYSVTLTCTTYFGTTLYTNSKTITVTVNSLPVIITQPIAQLDCEGASVNFTAVATGTGLNYIWQRKKPADASFITIPAEGNVSYPSVGKIKIDNVGSSQSLSGTQYQVVVTNSSGCSVTSTAATLSVNEITGILPIATNVTQCYGTNYSYTVSTSNPANVASYQWKSSVASGVWNNVVNGIHFSGATTATLNIINGTPAESAEYRVYITFHSSGADCNVNSSSRTRMITFLPQITPTTITHPTCSLSTGSVVLSGLPASGTWTLTRSGTSSAVTTGTGVSTTISGLASGTYNFTVSNSICTSPPSADVVINVQPTTPTTPVIASYTLPIFSDNDGTITLSGLPSGAWELHQIKDGGTATIIYDSGTTYTITGLSMGSYEFEVIGVCVSLRTAPMLLVPYVPAVSAATAVNCTGFTANWPEVPTATSYLLDVSTDSNFNTGFFVSDYHNLNVGNVSAYTVTGMPAGPLYYRIRAQNATQFSLPSATITVDPLVTNTWTGAWSNGTPTIDQNIVFNAVAGYSSTTDVAGCTCIVTSGNVVINSGHTLKITNWVHINGGSLTFNNNASLVQINDVPNTGNIIYKRITPSLIETDYTFWSSPVAGQTLNISPDYAYGTFYSYNSSVDNWEDESLSTTMVAGKGYIIRGQKPDNTAYNITGTFVGIPNNGDYKITSIIADKSYLLGNPYPSAINADLFLAANAGVLNGTLYFWTHNTGIQLASNITNGTAGSGVYAYTSDDYASYNGTGAAAVSGGAIPNGFISAGQGFLASTLVSPSDSPIVFDNSMRVAGTTLANLLGINQQFFKTKNSKTKITTALEKNRVWLNLTNSQGVFKQTLIGYVTDATNDYEGRFDGESYGGNVFLDFYSILQNKNLAIQGRALPFDENDKVSLGYRAAVDGTFTINIDKVDGLFVNQSVFLEDKLNNTVTDLKNRNYTFNTAAGTFNDRFVLRYTKITENQRLSIEETDVNDGIIVLYSNNYKTLIIRNNMQDATVNSVVLFNMSGQQINFWDVEKKEQTSIQIPIKNISPEIYIVKVKTTKGEITKKIVIR